MSLEVANFISEFVITNPPDDDLTNEMDDHIRLIKSVLLQTFNGSGGDVFDEALTVSRDVIDTWTGRLDALEAAPAAALITPVFGSEDIVFGDGNNFVVTGLGFQPKAIIAWSQVHPTGNTTSNLSHQCVATWYETEELPHAIQFSSMRGQPPARTLFSAELLVAISLNQFSEFFTDQMSVESVNSDGFELKKDFLTDEVYLMYIAMP